MEDLAKNAEDLDERKWISATEAAVALQLGRKYMMRTAKKDGYIWRQAKRNAETFFLRKEIVSWADFRQLRRHWLAKYKYPGRENRWTEQIDLELARRLFITTAEAAALLGVAQPTIWGMAARGRLPCYQTVPGRRGSRLWFSRRAVLQLAEDPQYLNHRETYWKGTPGSAGSVRNGVDYARQVRGGVPKGWLTTREAAERLGVKVNRVRTMRVTGRLRGEQIWRRNKPLKYWYYPDYEVERAISLREETKRLAGLPLQMVPGSAPDKENAAKENMAKEGAASGAPTTDTGTEERRMAFVPSPSPFRLDADGPEPKWACDDVNLTRLFFQLDRQEY